MTLDNGFFSFSLCKECKGVVNYVDKKGNCSQCAEDLLRWNE